MTKGILLTFTLALGFFIFSFTNDDLALGNSTSAKQNDSILLATLMDSFLIAQYQEYFENYDQLTNEYMDSVFYYENRLSWYGASISYTPDSLYKIVVYEGEGCGAYCNPNYESEILTPDNVKLGESPAYLFPIHEIYLLKSDPKTYLIIQNTAGKPAGFYSSIGKKVSIIDMSGPAPKQICFPSVPHESWDCDFRVEVPHFVDFDATVRFNPQTSMLKYEYLSVDVYAENMMETDSIIKGDVTFHVDGTITITRSAIDFSDTTGYGY